MKLHKLFAAAMMTLGLITAGNTCIKEVCAAEEQTADQSVATEAETPADESTASEAAEEETVENTHVKFTTYRGKDTQDAYHSFAGADGTVYLFLPSDANLAKVTLKSSETMVSTTLGEIGSDGKTLSGDFTSQPASIVMKDGTKVTLACTQSTLPSLSLRLKGGDLSDIHEDENAATTLTVESTILTDPLNPVNSFTLNGHAEIRGRGNSSWAFYDKKGYQLKLENSRSVLGMGKAKKWVLLANSSDATLMRNKLVFDTARAVGVGYAPEARYADLWIDGEYRGLYMIAEKAEIGKQRLNLTSGHGIVAEFDNAFFYQEDNFKDVLGNFWALKDYQTEDASEDFAEFQRRVDAFAEALEEKKPWDELITMFDEDQFARFYLVAEYFLNEELPTTSFYWYWDGPNDELHLGPIWDFDTCMADGDVPEKYYVWHNGYLKRLVEYSEFGAMLEEYYDKYCADIFELAPTTMDILNTKIGASAEMNYLRFDVLGQPDVKKHMFYATYKENLENQKNWLRDRFNLFNVADVCGEVMEYYLKNQVSDDGSKLTATLRTKKDLKSLQIYVQTEATGGADRTRYEAVKDENGNWVCEIDLIDFGQTGKYIVEAFVNGTTKVPDASGEFTLDEVPTVSYVVNGVDYSAVFDPVYYAEKYPDVKAASGDNPAKLFNHFVETGMKNRQQGSKEFDVDFYMKDNPDLVEKYGTDYAAFYEHYCAFGKAEGRKGSESSES